MKKRFIEVDVTVKVTVGIEQEAAKELEDTYGLDELFTVAEQTASGAIGILVQDETGHFDDVGSVRVVGAVARERGNA